MSDLIPVIRRRITELIANDLLAVQPMNEAHMDAVLKLNTDQIPYRQGDRVHDFVKGWLRYYGNDLIAESLWWKLKINGL